MIRDRNINYKYQNLFLPAAAFHHVTGSAGTADGVPAFAEIATTEITGLKMEVEDDEASWGSAMPTWIDFANDIHIRVHYANVSTESGTVIWTVKSFTPSFGETFQADDGTAISTSTLTDTLPTTANQLVVTPWAKVSGDTIVTSAGDWLKLHVIFTNDGANNANCWFAGLEILYLPKLTDGPQVNDQTVPTDA